MKNLNVFKVVDPDNIFNWKPARFFWSDDDKYNPPAGTEFYCKVPENVNPNDFVAKIEKHEKIQL